MGEQAAAVPVKIEQILENKHNFRRGGLLAMCRRYQVNSRFDNQQKQSFEVGKQEGPKPLFEVVKQEGPKPLFEVVKQEGPKPQQGMWFTNHKLNGYF